MKNARTGKEYQKALADKVDAARDELKMSMAEFSMAIGMSKSSYADKVYNIGNSFKTSELWEIARFYRAKTGRRLPGWPWLDSDHMKLLDGMLNAIE
jgi:hypothetical protein